jgi:uncharacterized membrane protein YkoI
MLAHFRRSTCEDIAANNKDNSQMNKRIIAAMAIAIGLGTIGALVYAGTEKDENKQKVTLTDMPPAVQKTIQDNLAGGKVTETVKETKEGKTYYEAEVQKSSGEKVEIKVAEDGKLINVGQEEDDDE